MKLACKQHGVDIVGGDTTASMTGLAISITAVGTARREDIVYRGENGELLYDFRINDLRLDYLIEKGYNLIIAFAAVPDCISRGNAIKTSGSKNKTRYKGKLFNTAPPSDYALWEEVCYEYTRHIVERYGPETVSKWYLHCYNEPDLSRFFVAEIPREEVKPRCEEYCKLYHAFERGVRRVSEKINIGGPALAGELGFLEQFLNYVRENGLKLDYIALHNYGIGAPEFTGINDLSVDSILENHERRMEVISRCGFEDTKIVIDEWGAVTRGYANVEYHPALMFRETELFSAYYAKLIYKIIEKGYPFESLAICLSGQHEMTEDFTGFRNFFTLNFIKKPIYNAFIMSSRLGGELLFCECDNENVFTVPTKRADGSYAVMLSYSSNHFDSDLPQISESIKIAECDKKSARVYKIDREATNPYRLYEKLGIGIPSDDEIRLLQKAGILKGETVPIENGIIDLTLSANSTFLIEV
jgi:xylan 1,4-beta-xylosidase